MVFNFRRLVFALLLLTLFFPSTVSAYYTNMPASVVIGQSTLTDHTTGLNSINFPSNSVLRGLFVDSKGRVIVSDRENNRVLIWNSVPTSSGAMADLVLGQPDFSTNTADYGGLSAQSLDRPAGVYSDGTKLFIVDSDNSRLLIWNTFPTVNMQAADVVVGQTNMTSITTTCDAQHLNISFGTPGTVWVYNNRLIVSTGSNQSRILIWNSIPTTNGVSADVVIGQPDLTTCSHTSTPSRTSVNSPRGIMVDSNGKLFVVDLSNANRVLIWNSVPTVNNTPADVVVGQPSFTSNTAKLSADGLESPFGVFSNGKRLFITDTNHNRVLVFNSIPTTNGAAADLVLGQPDFVTAGTYDVLANSLTPHMVFELQNKLFVSDSNGDRVLIFSNIIATPKLNMDTPPQDIGNGWLRVKGNILLGERDRYKMQWVKASVNGEGFSNVTNLDGGRDDGPGETRYEWYHDFTLPTDKKNEYTLKITASSFNADESSLFYFFPFKFLSFSDGNTQTLKFSVPTTKIQSIKDNVDHFELWSRGFDDGWKVYVPNIPTSLINTTTGEVTYSFTKNISGGKTDFKIVSVSKDSNWRFDSNVVTINISGPKITGLNLTSSSSSPLQLNNVGGSIVSTYNLTGVKDKYTLSSTTPIFKGIAYASSKVTMIVTNNVTEEERTYSVKVSPDSSFTISPILFPNSTITVYLVDPLGRFAVLPSFGVNLTQ